MEPICELPPHTRWIMSRRDLPTKRENGRFRVTKPDGTKKELILSKRKRQVVEALMKGPIYCASPVRLSDIVLLLRRENGIGIETIYFEDDSDDQATSFGVYVLRDQVERLEDHEPEGVAA